MTRLLARLAALDSASLSDALDRLGLPGVVTELVFATVDRRFCGVASTVELGPDDGRPSVRHLGAAAVDAAGPETVVVVANGGRVDCASWGGLLSLGASLRGVAGAVLDGACRDVDEARQLRFPVRARAAVPATARGRVRELSSGEPVTFAGVAVAPGDLVLADSSGVVFVAAAHAVEVLDAAEEIVVREAAMAAALRAGRPVAAVLDADYESSIRGRADDG